MFTVPCTEYCTARWADFRNGLRKIYAKYIFYKIILSQGYVLRSDKCTQNGMNIFPPKNNFLLLISLQPI